MPKIEGCLSDIDIAIALDLGRDLTGHPDTCALAGGKAGPQPRPPAVSAATR